MHWGKPENWKNNKNRTAIILLVIAQLFLLEIFIFPGWEKEEYFRVKIHELRQNIIKVEAFLVHLERQKERLKQMKEQIRKIGLDKTNSSILEQTLEQITELQKTNQLVLLNQQIKEQNREGFEQVIIRQNLQGKYLFQHTYLQGLEKLQNNFLISKLTLKTLAPLETDPMLQSEMELILYFPEYQVKQ